MVREATARRHIEATSALANDLGQRLRAARQEQGMTLAALAGDDFSRSYLSLIELGRSRPSLSALSILASRLDLPISYFLDGSQGAQELVRELALDQAEVAIRQHQAGEALRILASIDDPAHAGPRLLYLRGWALTTNGQRREALPVLHEGLQSLAKRDDVHLRIHIHYQLSRALYELSNVDEAIFHIRKALNLAIETEQDDALVGMITVSLGHHLFVQGRFDDALAHYDRARELFGRVNDLDSLAAVYAGLSRVYQHKDDLQQAVRYSRMSVAMYDAHHNQENAAHELNNVAARLADLGKLDEALGFAEEAVERSLAAASTDEEALARTTLAAIILERGDRAGAKAEAERALAVIGTESPLAQADAWVVLAKLADQEGDYEVSDTLFQQALEMLQEHGHAARFRDISLVYSLTLQERGNTELALMYALAAANERPANRR